MVGGSDSDSAFEYRQKYFKSSFRCLLVAITESWCYWLELGIGSGQRALLLLSLLRPSFAGHCTAKWTCGCRGRGY